MARGLLPFLIFGATYMITRLGLGMLQAQVWGPVLPPAQDPAGYLVRVLGSGAIAFVVTMLVMRGRWGRGERGGG